MPWWRRAVVYQIYVRSFADSDGDGLGDLGGIRSRLDYLAALGVDGIWLTPFYPTPDKDHGYDVADYCDVDPRFGDLDVLDGLVADAHERGLRVLVDLVPNHTSDQHPWFQAAIADPGAPERGRYLFASGRGGGRPPNNWESVFGGPAWTASGRDDEWYLHLFAPEQPDLNWRNPEVVEEFDRILRFWFNRGIDGMRIDVAHGMLKDVQLRDNPPPEDARIPPGAAALVGQLKERYSFDHEDVHEVFRRWRALVDAYPGDRALVGEVFLWDPARVARYVRTDELHLAFNFLLLGQKWVAGAMRESIELTLNALGAFGATATWVLSNHDVVRHATRFGGGTVGHQRARSAALLLLALPGAVFVYQGEELGLEEVALTDADRQDPVFFRTGGARKGRDGARVPLPWSSSGGPGYGFTTGTPWLPTPTGWGEWSVEAQSGVAGSMLDLYRSAIALRKATSLGSDAGLEWLDVSSDVVAFRRGDHAVVVNFGDEAVPLPVGGQVILSSDGAPASSEVAGNAAAWLRLP